tara:strand:+ start:871 stop:1536 length:666 start_codon:yes stop_codon:yes gene_type:complete
MNVLYVGSGNSAKLIAELSLDNYYIVAANNAWRLFENKKLDTWIHSGDFPHENRPSKKLFSQEISFHKYNEACRNIANKLGSQCKSAPHYVGYTIFFLGLYWIMDALAPDKISLLGFDHDYNPDKVEKWNSSGRPNPQNHYLKSKSESIKDWSNKFFDGMAQDSFYGQGTPDPLRLGKKYLINKFDQAINNCQKLNIDLVNISPVESEINSVKKERVFTNV